MQFGTNNQCNAAPAAGSALRSNICAWNEGQMIGGGAIQWRSHLGVTLGSLRTMHHFFTLKKSISPSFHLAPAR